MGDTYRNLETGEEIPAIQIGTAPDGREIYRSLEGHEPTFPYIRACDGNWVYDIYHGMSDDDLIRELNGG